MGQALENAALRGTDQASAADSGEACEGLGDITVWALSIATAVIGPIALLLRKVLLAFVAVGVIAGGQVTPQAFKRSILLRPEIVEVTGDYAHSSFPSRDTAIAMTVLVSAI